MGVKETGRGIGNHETIDRDANLKELGRFQRGS